jgi:hypothetical protein
VAIRDFHNRHAGDTCVIIGNGPGLNDIPLDLLKQHISFGVNQLYKRGDGFRPHYYVAVDSRTMREHRKAIEAAYGNLPFFLSSDLKEWTGRNVSHFTHRPGGIYRPGVNVEANPIELMDRIGIAWTTVVHAALQVAYYMGFTTLLCVGLDNKADGLHCYGQEKAGGYPGEWDQGYGELRQWFEQSKPPRRIINLSTVTGVTTLERGDWREYVERSGNGGVLQEVKPRSVATRRKRRNLDT